MYGSLLVLLLCLCKSVQRTLFSFACRRISEKRVQRYRLSGYPPNVFRIIFENRSIIDVNQGLEEKKGYIDGIDGIDIIDRIDIIER